MRMLVKKKEEKIIRGEVESYSQKITSFPGNRGTRGMRIEGEWHNIIGDKNDLENIQKSFPLGCFVRLVDVQNAKGYWDAPFGRILEITKGQAYSHEDQEKIENRIEPEVENVRDSPVKEAENEIRKEDPRREHLLVSKQDIVSMFDAVQKNPSIKAINLPFYLNKNQFHASLSISLSSNENPRVIMKAGPAGSPELLSALLLLLAHIELAKDMVFKRISETQKKFELEFDESLSQDGQQNLKSADRNSPNQMKG